MAILSKYGARKAANLFGIYADTVLPFGIYGDITGHEPNYTKAGFVGKYAKGMQTGRNVMGKIGSAVLAGTGPTMSQQLTSNILKSDLNTMPVNEYPIDIPKSVDEFGAGSTIMAEDGLYAENKISSLYNTNRFPYSGSRLAFLNAWENLDKYGEMRYRMGMTHSEHRESMDLKGSEVLSESTLNFEDSVSENINQGKFNLAKTRILKPLMGIIDTPGIGEPGYADRHQTSIDAVTNMSTLINLGSLLKEMAHLNRMSKVDYSTSARPDTIDPIDPRVPFAAARTALRTDKDRYFNTAVRQSRETGSPVPLGQVLEANNKANAQMGEIMMKILSQADAQNADIAYRNSQILSGYRDKIDEIKNANVDRDQMLGGAKAAAPGKFGQSIFQNYLNSMRTAQQLEATR